MSARPCALALVHYPVLDKAGAVVTTAITNLDLHDISRSVRAYGLSALYVVHPIAAQRALAQRVKDHWLEGSGGRRIPDRRAALERLVIVESLEAARQAFVTASGAEVELWSTAARALPGTTLEHAAARAELARPGPSVLLVFGTGWGLAPGVLAGSRQLAPLGGAAPDGWNHLSVRAAAAILLDRLLG